MGIRKSDIRDFIMGKARERKSAIQETVRVEVEATIKPVIFETYKDAEVVERQAQAFHDSFLQIIERYNRFDIWRLKSILRDVNAQVIGLRSDMVRQEVNLVVHNLLDLGTNGVMEEVQPYVSGLKEKLASKIAEYRDLVKLTNELITIIDSSHNGDKAYKRLTELGVDLSGFEVGGSNLPAVIKLSADPCLLNGNCV